MIQSQEPVILDKRGAICEIRFNRPDKLNALDVALAEGFRSAVAQAVADSTVRVIIVSAAGRAFVAGGDLGHFRSSPDRALAASQLIDPIHAGLKMLESSDKISIGALKGAVAGGGMSLALNFDLAIAAADTVFNLAYNRIAASPDCGGSWALPRLVGTRKALEIALLSESIEAAEALRLGLVNRIVPLDELDGEVEKIAARLAMGSAAAQGRTKLLMRSAFDRTHSEQLDAERDCFAASATSADFAEALDAFFAKRKPQFQGC
ncbi:MAG: enoyl-CoA hydratase/isomerase family protein [Rhizobium sp.]|nr:enoyl-CoA hydratase/isomerase family protein [Rhizobium sp.]